MAGSYNHIILIGRLTKDPEYKELTSGAVCSFSIAINRKTKSGDEVMYVDCAAFNGGALTLADTCNQYLRKGMNVLVDGRLQIRDYTTKDGDKRKATSVILNTMQMLDAKKDNDAARSSQLVGAAAGTQTRSSGSQQGSDSEEPDMSDVPF